MIIYSSFRNQFKAHPVNQKILQNPATGVRKVPSKPTTQVEEFNLEGLKRNQNKSIEKKEEKYEFHAQPVPKDILEGPVVGFCKYVRNYWGLTSFLKHCQISKLVIK